MGYMVVYTPGAPVVFAHGRRARSGRHRFCRMLLMDNKRQKKWGKCRDGGGDGATEICPVMFLGE